MTQTLNSRLDEAKRERAETEVQKLALTKERFNVEHSYQRLAALGREEAQLRERNIEGLKRERAVGREEAQLRERNIEGLKRERAVGREEAQLRERNIEGLKRERAVFFNKTLFIVFGAGAFGALLAGVTGEIARWMWATFLAVVSSG